MKKALVLASTLILSAGMVGSCDAAPPDKTAAQVPSAASLKIAEKDFGRVSKEGGSAFEDIHLARMAIFDGDTAEAAKYVADAQASLAKAKTDEAVFMKAESALQIPSKAPVKPKGQGENSDSPIAWIPIDSSIVLGESYEPTPEKAAAVVTAKKSLTKGDGKTALEAIRLEAIDVDYTVTVAPLKQSTSDVDEAAKFIAAHDYYKASQALKQAEDGIRYDEIDDVANVTSSANNPAAQAGVEATDTQRETVEQRITNLHTSLMITSEEEGKWENVAKAMRENAASMEKLASERSAEPSQGMTAVEDLKAYEKFTQEHADRLKNLIASFEVLYTSMPEAQKKVADEVFQKFGHKALQAHN